jgi:hypothetical protein
MTAAAQTDPASVALHALPEYEPPLRAMPPDPHEPDGRLERPRPPARPVAVGGQPVWDEPGPVRERTLRVISLVLEVLDGRRPAGHLGELVGPRLLASLETRSRRTGSAGLQHRLRTLHTCRPVDGVVEVCGTVTVSTPAGWARVIALAARVERWGDRWLCTTLRPLYPGLRLRSR